MKYTEDKKVRIFHGGNKSLGEHNCRDCKHCFGYASPNPKYWSCNIVKDDKLICSVFSLDEDGEVVVSTEDCPEFQKREGLGVVA